MDLQPGEPRLLWHQNKKWSDQFTPEIVRILQRHLPLIEVASIEEDMKHNTDLCLSTRSFRIACRVRRAEYRMYQDFTIRSSLPSGAPTELDKLLDGWGDYMFYGYGSDGEIVDWVILDLARFRKWFSNESTKPLSEICNRDGTKFVVIPFRRVESSTLASSFINTHSLF